MVIEAMAVFAAVSLISTRVMAIAHDGSTGSTVSSGDLTASVTISHLMKITSVGDLTAEYQGNGDLTLQDDVCVYTNDSLGRYKAKLTGDGPGFTIKKGSDHVDYAAFWNDEAGAKGSSVTSGEPLSGQTGASFSQSCTDKSGNVNGNFTLAFSKKNLLAVPAGTYTGHLTIEILPP